MTSGSMRHTGTSRRTRARPISHVSRLFEISSIHPSSGTLNCPDGLSVNPYKFNKTDMIDIQSPVVYSRVLQFPAEVEESIKTIRELGLPLHEDAVKNWDTQLALNICESMFSRRRAEVSVLDAGGEYYSSILPALSVLGYGRLECLNLAFEGDERRGRINYRRGDITKTDYPDGCFDAVLCLSVLEHGVDIGDFFVEMGRILKPEGVLVVSVDYWIDPVDTKGQTNFGVPVKIFDGRDLSSIVAESGKNEFILAGELDLTCGRKVVHFMGMEYTFALMTFRK